MMKTVKKILTEVIEEIHTEEMKYTVVVPSKNGFPAYAMALFRSEHDAKFFVDNMLKNYPKDDQVYFEVRKIIQ